MAAKQVIIREALEVEQLANRLIEESHPHLADARLLYLFTNQKRRKCDRVRLASAARLSALQRYLSSGTAASVEQGADFVVLVGKNEWDDLTPEQRQALVDHELCHCWRFEKTDRRGKTRSWYGLPGHDVEEFTEVIARHGLWRRDIKELGRVAAQQLGLPLPGASDGDRRVERTEMVVLR